MLYFGIVEIDFFLYRCGCSYTTVIVIEIMKERLFVLAYSIRVNT